MKSRADLFKILILVTNRVHIPLTIYYNGSEEEGKRRASPLTAQELQRVSALARNTSNNHSRVLVLPRCDCYAVLK